MRIIYYFATSMLHYLLLPYLYFRILKKKESPLRFREKLAITNTQRDDGYLMWFHCASIGELKSIFPISDHYVKKNRILITTSTLSSSEIFYKKYSDNKNIIHQFSPIDSPQIVRRFFLKWKPNIIFFTDSELWPNQIFYAKNKNIPIILLNGRISKKSFSKWRFFKTTMHEILKSFKLILCNSNQSFDYFHYFKTNNIETIGNLKFIISESLDQKNEDNVSLQKRIIFIALSTHDTEEEFCIKAHISLKLKYPNLLTLIIPRHINRIAKIEEIVKKLKLNSLTQDSLSNIKDNTLSSLNDYTNPFNSFTIVPNPATESTSVNINLSNSSITNISVFDVTGRLVQLLNNSALTAGSHTFTWDLNEKNAKAKAGVYFIKVSANGYSETKRVVVL